MEDKFRDVILPIPEKHLGTLRKDVEKYKENVNKCNISMIDSLSFDIGSTLNFMKFVTKPTEDQRNQLKNLEKEYETYSNKVKQCQCVKKLYR